MSHVRSHPLASAVASISFAAVLALCAAGCRPAQCGARNEPCCNGGCLGAMTCVSDVCRAPCAGPLEACDAVTGTGCAAGSTCRLEVSGDTIVPACAPGEPGPGSVGHNARIDIGKINERLASQARALEDPALDGRTRAQIEAAITDGATAMNQVKQFTRCGMGPCQGRMCGEAAAELVAAQVGGREKAGFATGRVPLRPVAMDALLGDFDYADIPVPRPAPI